MAITSNPFFDDLSKLYGPFYATMLIARSADAVYKALPGRIMLSTAIDMIANYLLIDPEDFPDHRLDVAYDFLQDICGLNPDVIDAVLLSYRSSLDYDSIVFKYLNVKDEYDMSMVRVLTRMLWDMRPDSN